MPVAGLPNNPTRRALPDHDENGTAGTGCGNLSLAKDSTSSVPRP